MKIQVLDKLDNKWMLAKVSLWDYIDSLSPDDFEYDIQRGIVKNPYLDSILVSVKNGDPIPPISIVGYGIENVDTDSVSRFDILDGLQRTYRLWVYKQLSEIAIKAKTDNYQKAVKTLYERNPNYPNAVTPRQIRQLFEKSNEHINVWNLRDFYANYSVYLYVWIELSDTDAVKKMLILNAGQKRMGLAHQYELMYRHIFKFYKENNNGGIHLVSEKDPSVNDVKAGKRAVGEFPISSVIIGLQSLFLGKPVRLSSDVLYDKFNNAQEDEEFMTTDSADLFFTHPFINKFLGIMFSLDEKISSTNADMKKWLVKDTTISGIFGGIGEYYKGKSLDENSFANLFAQEIPLFINSLNDKDPFLYSSFVREYDNLSSTRINIGMVVRKAICHYTLHLLSGKKNNTWSESFKHATKKK